MSSSHEDWFNADDALMEELAGRGMISDRRRYEQTPFFWPARVSLGTGSERLMRTGKLAGLVAATILVLVGILTLLGGTDYASSDRAYFKSLGVPAADSQSIGRTFERDLARAGPTRSSLVEEVAGLLRRQQADDTALESLSSPPLLRDEQTQAVTAFLLRMSGLSGFLTGLRDPKESAAALSSQGARLLTSDVLWQTFFQVPAAAELQRERVTGLTPPGSSFLSNGDVVSSESLAHDLAAGTSSQIQATAALKLGAHGPEVTSWQHQLARWLSKTHRAGTVVASGIFDQATQSATMVFQQVAGITPDGVVGPVTSTAMARALAGN
jgi:hypothetical protein